MRHNAGALAAAIVFAVISPAFAQPFADTPPNHWAYDAITELAAKGLIEGYPDGAFEDDRAMTRYEMALVVARLLARIESIQIPEPQKPEVTKEDIDNIRKLVNEFRAELAAKNMGLTAVDEELNAIKARLGRVPIFGGIRIRLDSDATSSGPSIDGNPRAGSISATNNIRRTFYWEFFKLGFEGSAAPDMRFSAGITTNGRGSDYFVFNSRSHGPGTPDALSVINFTFLDLRNPVNMPLEIWLDRFGGYGPGGAYPVQFKSFGLLLNTSTDTCEDTMPLSGLTAPTGCL